MNFVSVGLIVSLVFAGIIYIATQNLFSTLSLFLISLAFFVLIARKLINKNQQKIHRYHQCYQFINTFIVALNVKGSLSSAINSAYETADESVKEIMTSINELSEAEKLEYLGKFFKFDLYHLFVDLINLWNEQGGNIIHMSQHLLTQLRLKEEYLITCQTINRSKSIEFVVLWAIALIILAALRFALSQFFLRISQTIFYQIAVVVVILFALISIYILLLRITNLRLEGWKDDEK